MFRKFPKLFLLPAFCKLFLEVVHCRYLVPSFEKGKNIQSSSISSLFLLHFKSKLERVLWINLDCIVHQEVTKIYQVVLSQDETHEYFTLASLVTIRYTCPIMTSTLLSAHSSFNYYLMAAMSLGDLS